MTTLPGINVPTPGSVWFKCSGRSPMFASATVVRVLKDKVRLTMHGECGPDGEPIEDIAEPWDMADRLFHDEWHPTLEEAVCDLRDTLIKEQHDASDVIAENQEDLILLSKWEEGK